MRKTVLDLGSTSNHRFNKDDSFETAFVFDPYHLLNLSHYFPVPTSSQLLSVHEESIQSQLGVSIFLNDL